MAANPGGGPYKAVVLSRFQDIAMRMEDLITTGPQVPFDDSQPRQQTHKDWAESRRGPAST